MIFSLCLQAQFRSTDASSIALRITKNNETEMAKVLSGFLRETEAQMPVIKKKNIPVSYPDEVI